MCPVLCTSGDSRSRSEHRIPLQSKVKTFSPHWISRKSHMKDSGCGGTTVGGGEAWGSDRSGGRGLVCVRRGEVGGAGGSLALTSLFPGNPQPPLRLLPGSRRGSHNLRVFHPVLGSDGAAQFCFLYLFRIQSASSMALLIICWILSGLSSSE